MTAVEFLKQNLPSLFQDDSGHYANLFEQAKEMEKQQIIDAYGVGHNEGCIYMTDGKTEFIKDSKQYYNETYGSKRSDTPQVTPQVTSSKTEISDEKIANKAEEFEYTDGIYGFKEGVKWYREQLKQTHASHLEG